MTTKTTGTLVGVGLCLLLCGCGDDGETTDSVANNPSSADAGEDSLPPAGVIQFSASTYNVSESDGSVTVTLTRTGGTAGNVSVRYASANGTATQPQDYTGVSGTLSFSAGDTQPKTLTIAVAADAVDEPDETFTLSLSAPSGRAVLGAANETLLTVLDDDIPAPSKPTAVLSAAYKHLRIDWTAASNATSYRVLKDATGSGIFSQIGVDLPATQRHAEVEVTVHLEDWLNARYVVAACNATGCTQSDPLSGNGKSESLIGYLKATNSSKDRNGDSLVSNFGSTTAISANGNTLVIGAPGESSAATGINGDQTIDCDTPVNCAHDSGAVYVYSRSGANWVNPVYVKASNPQANALFGTSVALSADGDTLVVGAPRESSATQGIGTTPTGTASSSGAVYVYSRTATGWSAPVYIKASNSKQSYEFGSSVALNEDGSILAVGAPREGSPSQGVNASQVNDCQLNPSSTCVRSGAVYVYTRTATGWSAPSFIKAFNADSGDEFGAHVRLSGEGTTLAVSATAEDSSSSGVGSTPDNSAFNAGAVYVYLKTPTGWAEPTYIKASNTQANMGFGRSLSMNTDGDTLAIGAPYEDSASGGIGGNAAHDCTSNPQVNCLFNAGAVYLYTRGIGTWSAPVYLKASSPEAYSSFGGAVALSGDGRTLVVSSPYESGGGTGINPALTANKYGAGAAFVYLRGSMQWTSGHYIKSSNSNPYDNFGISLALSYDALTLAVGAPSEGGAATGFNGNQLNDCLQVSSPLNCLYAAGAVYVY